MSRVAYLVEPVWSAQVVGAATWVNWSDMATVSILSRDKAALQTALSQALPPDRSVWRCARRRPLLNRLQERRLRSSLHPAAFVEGDWQGAWVIEPAPSSPWSDSADLIDRFFVIDTARDAQWVLNAIHEADEAARGYFGAPPETSNYARQYRERYRWGRPEPPSWYGACDTSLAQATTARVDSQQALSVARPTLCSMYSAVPQSGWNRSTMSGHSSARSCSHDGRLPLLPPLKPAP